MEPVAIAGLIVGVVALAVGDYDTSIATFPAVLMAGPMGFAKRAFFEAEPAAAQTPAVELQ